MLSSDSAVAQEILDTVEQARLCKDVAVKGMMQRDFSKVKNAEDKLRHTFDVLIPRVTEGAITKRVGLDRLNQKKLPKWARTLTLVASLRDKDDDVDGEVQHWDIDDPMYGDCIPGDEESEEDVVTWQTMYWSSFFNSTLYKLVQQVRHVGLVKLKEHHCLVGALLNEIVGREAVYHYHVRDGSPLLRVSVVVDFAASPIRVRANLFDHAVGKLDHHHHDLPIYARW